MTSAHCDRHAGLFIGELTLFWRTSLQTVYTDLSRASLQRLETIAQHPQQHYIRHLTLKGHQLGEGFQWTRHGDGHLLPEQPATKQLCNIIHQLDNCKSFEIYAISKSDEPDISDDVSGTDSVSGTDDVRDTDAAPIILDAIAASCFLVTSFTANFRIGDHLNHPDPRRLGKAPVDKAGFIAAWSHLKELTLSLDFECDSNEEWALDLILHAPNLEKLNLEVGSEENSFIDSLASANTSWPQLQELQFEKFEMEVEDLSALLHKLQGSLRFLKLELVSMSYDSGDDLKSLFQDLGKFPKLETVKFWNLWVGACFFTNKLVHFPALWENPIIDEVRGTRFAYMCTGRKGAWRIAFVDYSGPKMDVALDVLARTLEVV